MFQKHAPSLSYDELAAVRKNLQRTGVNVENDYVRDTWHVVFRRHFLNRSLARAYDCRKGFYLYNQGLETEVRVYRCSAHFVIQCLLTISAF